MGLCCCACTACSCVGSVICKTFERFSPSSNARYHYAFVMLAVTITAILIQQFGDEMVVKDKRFCDLITNEANCEGNASVFRILMSLSMFFLVHVICVRITGAFHRQFWLLKLLALIVCIICMFWIPNDVFEGYSYVGLGGACVFVLLQIVVFINMLYDWNEDWISRELFIPTIAVTTFLYALSILFYVLSFVSFGGNDCVRNQSNLIASLIVSVLLTIGSIYAPHGAILPSSGVSAYLAWILYSGLSNEPDDRCNSDSFGKWQKVLSLVIVVVAIGYFCIANADKAGRGKKEKDSETNDNSEELKVRHSHNKTENGTEKETEEEDVDVLKIRTCVSVDDVDEHDKETVFDSMCSPKDPVQSKNLVFHTLMFFASLYLMMVISSWSTSASAKGDLRSEGTVVAHIVSHWMVVALYIVTLSAPLLLPGRFYESEDIDEEEDVNRKVEVNTEK